MIPAYLADQFGSKNIGPTHGLILTSWAIAGVSGGLIFSAVYKRTLSSVFTEATKVWSPADAKYSVYDTNFYWILVIVCISFVFACLVPANLRDRRLPKVPGERFRFRFGRRLVRCIGFKFVVVSKEQEDQEWTAYLSTVM